MQCTKIKIILINDMPRITFSSKIIVKITPLEHLKKPILPLLVYSLFPYFL